MGCGCVNVKGNIISNYLYYVSEVLILCISMHGNAPTQDPCEKNASAYIIESEPWTGNAYRMIFMHKDRLVLNSCIFPVIVHVLVSDCTQEM